jgi:hypothetical protein
MKVALMTFEVSKTETQKQCHYGTFCKLDRFIVPTNIFYSNEMI